MATWKEKIEELNPYRSIADLERKAGLGKDALAKALRPGRDTSWSRMVKVARALNVRLDDLADDSVSVEDMRRTALGITRLPPDSAPVSELLGQLQSLRRELDGRLRRLEESQRAGRGSAGMAPRQRR